MLLILFSCWFAPSLVCVSNVATMSYGINQLSLFGYTSNTTTMDHQLFVVNILFTKYENLKVSFKEERGGVWWGRGRGVEWYVKNPVDIVSWGIVASCCFSS